MKTYDINAVEEQLKTQDTVAYLTSGASMRPLLRTHKDIVVISKAQHPLSVGDVPLYKKKGVEKLILHRIIGVSPDGTYIIRGDNTYQKEYVPQSDVVGVMTAIYRGGKYIDCSTSRLYKIYAKTNRILYPVRWLWKTKIRALLGRMKRKILS
ncbi:MAG: S24/S26 family peptidase [Clostridia bacterium]|nr:S24/S26 family peptidase [Clostridia bacterium]